MDLQRRVRDARDLTPVDQQIARTALAMGDRLRAASIKEFARAASVSIASVHRFCKKVGLEGFKDLKVELVRAQTARDRDGADVDFNFPFGPGEQAACIVPHMRSLYGATLRDTCDVLDTSELERAAEVLGRAQRVGIYTQSHNLYPARMFRDRLLSIGRDAFCDESFEQQFRRALAASEHDAAVVISYSGLSPDLGKRLGILAERQVPVVFIGTPAAKLSHPGLAAYLLVSDREHLQDRITQFASHISVQFVLDALFSCVFAAHYETSEVFLRGSLPYTRLNPTPAMR